MFSSSQTNSTSAHQATRRSAFYNLQLKHTYNKRHQRFSCLESPCTWSANRLSKCHKLCHCISPFRAGTWHDSMFLNEVSEKVAVLVPFPYLDHRSPWNPSAPNANTSFRGYKRHVFFDQVILHICAGFMQLTDSIKSRYQTLHVISLAWSLFEAFNHQLVSTFCWRFRFSEPCRNLPQVYGHYRRLVIAALPGKAHFARSNWPHFRTRWLVYF